MNIGDVEEGQDHHQQQQQQQENNNNKIDSQCKVIRVK